MSNKSVIVREINIQYEIFKYVLGRGRENLKALQNKYQNLKIYVQKNKHSITIEGLTINPIDNCAKDINDYVMSSYAYRESVLKRKKINKEKEAKKKSIQASNQMKENIKKELEQQALLKEEMEKANKEGKEYISIKDQTTNNIIKEQLKYNPYYVLLGMEE